MATPPSSKTSSVSFELTSPKIAKRSTKRASGFEKDVLQGKAEWLLGERKDDHQSSEGIHTTYATVASSSLAHLSGQVISSQVDSGRSDVGKQLQPRSFGYQKMNAPETGKVIDLIYSRQQQREHGIHIPSMLSSIATGQSGGSIFTMSERPSDSKCYTTYFINLLTR